MSFITDLFAPVVALYREATANVEAEVNKLRGEVTSAVTSAETAVAAEAQAIADQINIETAKLKSLFHKPAP